ncbi:aldehyde dehydrogenase (NADP(+)) [Pararhodobacter sp. CCB-MM2]|uniref:aldehyde dehydrogenase (NADP(+)) n=1 Tax=Pararhodobacter sp. CCB-MM2 TaxID=1786003 RepID=UPI00350F7B48
MAGQLVTEPDSTRAVALAAEAAEAAFDAFSALPGAERAALLEAIADEMTARGPAIIAAAVAESGLPEARITGELGRTTGQLRLFADHVRAGRHLDLRHDPALPDRKPAPRPDLRLMQVAIGPVAVFGASNFPLAFSVAGGDTASALAAGCPVVVKEHSAHPLTSQRVAAAIDAAIARTGAPRGVFSLIRAQDRAAGTALVQHPLIRAVGFTGSLAGGKALFDLCAARPEPIPFFGELGAVNPMFVLPEALAARGEAIAQGWAASLTMGAGQFCTNPGIAILPAGAAAETFARTASLALSRVPGQTMLTDGIAAAYRKGLDALDGMAGVEALLRNDQSGREALPNLARVDGETFLSEPHLAEEIFGPAGLLVIAEDAAQMLSIARGLQGQLTATLHLDDADHAEAAPLLRILSRKAGRLLANGFPTGVEVCDAMVHGGPHPASTNFGATSVGTLAIRRFLRPLCFQDIPAALLPAELR